MYGKLSAGFFLTYATYFDKLREAAGRKSQHQFDGDWGQFALGAATLHSVPGRPRDGPESGPLRECGD